MSKRLEKECMDACAKERTNVASGEEGVDGLFEVVVVEVASFSPEVR